MCAHPPEAVWCRTHALFLSPTHCADPPPPPPHTQVPALVMRSVENARSALDDGDFEKVRVEREKSQPINFSFLHGWLVDLLQGSQ
jgi:hypothetical protein